MKLIYILCSFFCLTVSAQLYVQQFDLSGTAVNFSGNNSNKFSYSRLGDYGACGEVRLTMYQDSVFSSGFQAFNFDFPSGVSIPSASEAVIKIRLRASSPMPIRACFRGNVGGVKNLSCQWAREEKNYTSSTGDWEELVFTYSTAADLKASGCTGSELALPGSVSGIAINLNTGTTTFPGSVYIDYISIGTSSPSSGNAACKTDVQPGVIPSAIITEAFDPNAVTKALSGTEINNSNITQSRIAPSSGATCGEVEVQNASGNITASYTTVNYDSLFTLPDSKSAVIRIRAKVTNATAVPVRACFRGDRGNGKKNLSRVWSREQKSLPGDGQWHELTFIYSFTDDLDTTAGTGAGMSFPANLAGVALSFYSGANSLTNPISIDYISVSDAPANVCSPVTGVYEEIVDETLLAYPNPAMDKLMVQGFAAGTQYKLVNAQGQTMEEGIVNSEHTELLVSQYSRGLYQLICENNLGIVTQKVVLR